MQLVGDMMNKKTAPRTALMLPAMVYAHLVLLDIVNVKGEIHIQSPRSQWRSMLLRSQSRHNTCVRNKTQQVS